MPKVSIIMGIYNCQSTLAESIDSILKQTYTDWELIMCDDGSTDDTIEIAKQYAQKDSRITVLENKTNRGLAYSLNKGLQVATGEYIARMDGDDISLPERLEIQMAYMESHPEVDVLGTNTQYFDENGIWGTNIGKTYLSDKDIACNSPFAHPTVIMKKVSLIKVEGYTVNKLTYRLEDYDLWCKFSFQGYKVVLLEDVLFQVRLTADAYKRRKFKYRIDEYKLKKYWHKKFKLPFKTYLYVFKPLIVGCIPGSLMYQYHKYIYGK